MSNYHKPRTFRSLQGCCICRAKSSSSRFTDSDKYEEDFTTCFKVDSGRKGDICNACVLLVKRWKKLPRGSKKNWSHVVDARSTSAACYKAASVSTKQKIKPLKDDPDLKAKKIIKKRAVSVPSYLAPPTPDQDNAPPVFCDSPEHSVLSDHTSSSISELSQHVSPFLDLRYWKRTKVCCGVVFLGDNQDLAIDVDLFKPCAAHRNRRPPTSTGSTRSRTDTVSSHNSSVMPVLPESPIESTAIATGAIVNIRLTDNLPSDIIGREPTGSALGSAARVTRQTVNMAAS